MKMISLDTEVDWDEVREDYRKIRQHEDIIGSYVPEIEVMNSNRVKLQDGDKPVYMGPHLTHGDHFTFPYAILQSELPYARCVASIHFKDTDFEKLFGFGKRGVIWHDRDNHSVGYIRDYWRRVFDCLEKGDGVFFHPEGKRNKHPERGLLDFKDAAFKMFFGIQENMRELEERDGKRRRLVFECMGSHYDHYPEEGYYDKIGDDPSSEQYKKWEKVCLEEWLKKSLESKGRTIINFGDPIYLDSIEGNNNRERGENASRIIREKILQLNTEIVSSKLKQH